MIYGSMQEEMSSEAGIRPAKYTPGHGPRRGFGLGIRGGSVGRRGQGPAARQALLDHDVHDGDDGGVGQLAEADHALADLLPGGYPLPLKTDAFARRTE